MLWPTGNLSSAHFQTLYGRSSSGTSTPTSISIPSFIPVIYLLSSRGSALCLANNLVKQWSGRVQWHVFVDMCTFVAFPKDTWMGRRVRAVAATTVLLLVKRMA